MKDHDFEDLIEKLKEDNPLPVVAEAHNVDMHPSGQAFLGKCPFHDDQRPSFSIYLGNKGWRFKCYGASCQKTGDVFDFVGIWEFGDAWTRRGPQFTSAMEALGAQRFEKSRSHNLVLASAPRERPKITPRIKRIWDISLAIYGEVLFSPEYADVLAYLRKRHFTNATLRRYRFGFCPREKSPLLAATKAVGITQQDLLDARILAEGEYGTYEFFRGAEGQSGRIVVADIDHAYAAKYILGRILPWEDPEEVSAKYLGLRDFAKPILGASSLRRSDDPVLLVEGWWNRLTLWQWGYDAIAVSGAQLSPDQKGALARLRRTIVPVRDMDHPDAKGNIPGLIALQAWRDALPGMPEGIELPMEVDGVAIKDVNDLDKDLPAGVGEAIFADLAKRWGVFPKKK